jgi:hypothetical protein
MTDKPQVDENTLRTMQALLRQPQSVHGHNPVDLNRTMRWILVAGFILPSGDI